MASDLTHKEMTKHIRRRIRAAGIKARCRLYVACQINYIAVDGVTCEGEFSDDDQRTIRSIAEVNGLTLARGAAIDVEQMTNSKQFLFEYHAN